MIQPGEVHTEDIGCGDDEEPPSIEGIQLSLQPISRSLLTATTIASAHSSGGLALLKANGPARPRLVAEPSSETRQIQTVEGPPRVARPAATTRRREAGNAQMRAFRKRFFPEATESQWNDWRWQSQHRIRKLEQFEQIVNLSEDERGALSQGGTMLPVGVTPYYMGLLDPDDALQPLRKTVIPTTQEFVRTVGEADDPLGEDGHSPVPGLVHRYPDRVLLLPLDFCSTYCRYCTRSRVVGHGEIVPNAERLEKVFHYLE